MPIHDFQHPESGEIISVYVAASEPSVNHQIQEKDGKVYKRVYFAPRAAVDSRMTDTSKEEFRRITNKSGITQGALWELSKEMSERRAEKEGVDPVKQKFYRNYEKEFGTKHSEEVKAEKRRAAEAAMERAGEKLKKMGLGG